MWILIDGQLCCRKLINGKPRSIYSVAVVPTCLVSVATGSVDCAGVGACDREAFPGVAHLGVPSIGSSQRPKKETTLAAEHGID